MKQISQQSRFLQKEKLDPVVQTGKVIDYNPSNATCTVQLSNGGIVKGMPVLGITGSDYGTDLSFLNNLRGSSVVILRADNFNYVLSTIPTQIKFNEKIAETSSSGGLRLVVKNISKSSAKQRMGRTGRTREGFCFRMCTANYFNKLPEQRAAEITRAPITNVAIEFINVGLDPVALFKGRVSEQRMKDTLDLLKELKIKSL
jgi:hypothetical protein